MKINLFCLMTLAILAYSCSSKPPKKNPELGKNPETAKEAPPTSAPSMEAKQLANEQSTNLVTEFEFKKGQETLSPQSKKRIEELSKQALKKGRIEAIKVITWADQEYPSPKKKMLSSDQISLAHNRNTEIQKYLKKMYPNQDVSGKIELISMAERPTFYNKLISSDDARIKRSLESGGIPNPHTKNKTTGKTSRSIVLIIMKQ
jgi:outer membrane protein OmpA-like peptidoglycan-associated protein